MKKHLGRILFLLLLSMNAFGQFYNGYQMQFGKNRVQYDDRFWSFMKFKNFDCYYYLGGLELAAFTGNSAARDLEEIEKLFDYKLDGKIQFIIYNKLSDAKQSNIGLETNELTNNTGGSTKIVGNKVFLYFTGDHETLHRQIRAGIARVLIDQIMFGGDIKDRLQSSFLLSLPDWYINGLVDYIANPWDVNIDNRVADGILSGRYFKFNRLSGKDAVYVGHSLWKYIVDTYTSSSISNLLYMTRINRNIESGLMYVLGLSVKDLSNNWKDAMLSRYANADNRRDSIPGSILKKTKSRCLYTQLKTSPDGRYSTYVINDLGKYKVMLFDHDKKKSRRLIKSGYRSYSQETDISFPVLAWHPSGQLFGVIRERKGKLLLGTYTIATKKFDESPLFNFEKVLDFSYSDDGQAILLSAIQKGQSDIFIFNLRTRTYEQITRDVYDDLNPRFINNGKAIVFSSNRTNDTISLHQKRFEVVTPGKFDIFFYDYIGKANVLRRITHTEYFNELQPMPYDSANISYLSDENGIMNRYVAHIDSAISFVDTVEHYRMIIDNYPQTNYARNIISTDVNSRLNRVSNIFIKNGKYVLSVERRPETVLSEASLPKTLFRNEVASKPSASPTVVKSNANLPPQQNSEQVSPIDSNLVDIDNYIFQSDLPKSKTKKEKKVEQRTEQFGVTQRSSVDTTITSTAQRDTSGYAIPKLRNYETAFSSNYFVSQFDNILLNQNYQLFTGGGGAIFFNPGLNFFIKLGISDLLEDYRITGGFKLGFDLNSNEYFLSFENLKKRMDKQLTFYRQSLLLDQFGSKQHSHELRYTAKWPFSDVSSLRGSIAYRNDRVVALSTDYNSLLFPNQYFNWGSARIEYVLDNTLPTGINLYNGMRMKFFGEYYKQVDRSNSGLTIVGMDIRHYQKVHRDIIWANRLAAGTSFGPEKLIFYMGGTDSWLSPKFNNETPIDYSQNYYFQTLATNLRGFDQNIRNGNTFAAINSELRVPLFKYLINRPIKSDFIRNFQVVGFGDVGTAWNGNSPYDSTNALNRKFFNTQPFEITIISQNEPIVGGFGFGLRSRILGYFLRVDWAWGVQNREVLPRKFYFSIGLDF